MKIKYDPEADAMRITFNDRPYHRTKQVTDLVMVDVSEDGTPIGIELLRVSWFTDDLDTVIAQYSPHPSQSTPDNRG